MSARAISRPPRYVRPLATAHKRDASRDFERGQINAPRGHAVCVRILTSHTPFLAGQMFSVLTFAEATYGSEQFRSAVSPVTVSCYVDDIYLLSGAGGGYELRRLVATPAGQRTTCATQLPVRSRVRFQGA
jgi:hypothetical protein